MNKMKMITDIMAILSFLVFVGLLVYGIIHGNIGYAALSIPFLILSGLFDRPQKPKKDIFML